MGVLKSTTSEPELQPPEPSPIPCPQGHCSNGEAPLAKVFAKFTRGGGGVAQENSRVFLLSDCTSCWELWKKTYRELHVHPHRLVCNAVIPCSSAGIGGEAAPAAEQ